MATLNVIPYPTFVEYVGPEQYLLPRSPSIQCDAADETLLEKATYLQRSLMQRFNTNAVIQASESGQHAAGAACPAITLLLVEQLQPLDNFRWKEEAYMLKCGPQGIIITALTTTGVFYGIQTLLQALRLAPEGLVLPYTQVLDAPRFIWRGVLLDAGRHFFSVPFVLKLLDLMALYKLNKFHWHLTEDQGWRLEVPSLPRLAEVAAYRGTPPSIIPLPPPSSAAAATNSNCSSTSTASHQDTTIGQQQQQPRQEQEQESQAAAAAHTQQQQQQQQQQREQTPPPVAAAAAAAAAAKICGRAVPTAAAYHGGYYSMDDVAAVVRYAAERCIEVVPEIELPGHCVAALAAYPHLSCTGDVSAVSTHWGIHEDVYCAVSGAGVSVAVVGSEDVFSFLGMIFDQLVQQFPCHYVHIGGDEVPKVRWEECQKCQARMRQEGVSSEAELQSWFVRRVSKMLAARGRRLIGWDEILEGGLAEGATVMSWRGNVGGIIAAKSGHDVIMTPTSHCYFDYRQAPNPCEPGAWYACLPLSVVYSYDPIPSPWPDSSAAAAPAPAAAGTAAAAGPVDCDEDGAVGMQLGTPGNSGDQSSMSHSYHQDSTPDDADDAQSLLPPAAAAASCGSTGNTTAFTDGGGKGFGDQAIMHDREAAAATATCKAGEIGCSSPAAASWQSPAAITQQQQQASSRDLSPAPPVQHAAVRAADADAAGPHFPGDPPGASLAAMLPAAAAADEGAASTPTAAAGPAATPAGSRSSMPGVLSAGEAAHILGSQANLWCEYVQDEDTAEYMLLPRLAALAEAVWTPIAVKDWPGFRQRLSNHLPLLQQLGYKYRPLD